MEQNKKLNSSWMIVLIVVVILGGMIAYTISQRKGDDESALAPATTAQKTYANYKDGTYSAVGAYRSPAGEESIDVTLTLKGNVVSDVAVVPNATAPFSKKWQGKFIEGVKAAVVGVKLDDLDLKQVSGSSLTPKGFDDAVEQIKAQAKA